MIFRGTMRVRLWCSFTLSMCWTLASSRVCVVELDIDQNSYEARFDGDAPLADIESTARDVFASLMELLPGNGLTSLFGYGCEGEACVVERLCDAMLAQQRAGCTDQTAASSSDSNNDDSSGGEVNDIGPTTTHHLSDAAPDEGFAAKVQLQIAPVPEEIDVSVDLVPILKSTTIHDVIPCDGTSSSVCPRISVITVAKVASSAFLFSLGDKYDVHHGHSLQTLRQVLSEGRDQLVIVGIRDPLARNLAYFFQTYADLCHNDVKCRACTNGYAGEYTFVMSPAELLTTPVPELIESFFKQSWHETFNAWFSEFFEITRIDQQPFDKEHGYQLYKLPNNNHVLCYTMEKLKQNAPFFEHFFGIEKLLHTNDGGPNGVDQAEKAMYREMASTIRFPEEYSHRLLLTETMAYFYDHTFIANLAAKYGTT